MRSVLVLVFALACSSPPPSIDAGIDGASVHDARVAPERDARIPPGDAALGDDAGDPHGITIDDALAALSAPGASAAELDALIADVAFDSGWPMHEGTRWLFATRWDDAPEPVAVVSDINAWDPSRHPAARTASGVHFYAVIDESELAVPAVGAKYKWHGGGDVFRAPPESLAYGYDEFGAFGWVAAPLDRPHLERFPDFRSAHLDAPRALRAYLPAGFVPRSAGAAHARVLFLHDGQNVFHPDAAYGGWRVDQALAAPAYADVVALAVDNAADRFDAYTHVPDDAIGPLVGGRADDYLRMIEDEVLPFFRARYGIAAAGHSLAIAGSSLGGLVSLYFAIESPSLAGCTIAMSPTLGWGAYREGPSDALLDRWNAHGAGAIYLDSGGRGICTDPDEDGIYEDAASSSDNYCVTTQLRDHLSAIGYAFDVDLAHYWEPDATHDEAAWAARVPGALAACAAMGWNAP